MMPRTITKKMRGEVRTGIPNAPYFRSKGRIIDRSKVYRAMGKLPDAVPEISGAVGLKGF